MRPTACFSYYRLASRLDIRESLKLRWLLPKDHEQVARIAAESYGAPYDPELLARQIREASAQWSFQVAEYEELVLGYSIFAMDQPGIVRIQSLAVSRLFRRQGIGTALLRPIAARLRGPEYRRCVSIDVPETCDAGLLFLRSHGFRALRVVHAEPHDLIRMELLYPLRERAI